MTAREFLAQVRKLDALIAVKENRIEELRAYTQRVRSVNYGKTRVRISDYGSSLGLDEILDRIDQTVREEEIAIKELGERIKEVSAAISDIDDCQQSLCLTLRYIKLMPWREVADVMGLSERQVARLHIKALGKIKVPED